MTEQYKAPDDDAEGEEDPRRQLWIRAGVAVGLISLLLGGLAVFDHLSRPPQPEEVVAPTKPIAPAQVATEAGRDAPPEVLRAGSPGPEAAAPAEAASEAEGSAPPVLPGMDKADRLAQPERAGRSVEGSRPSARSPAVGHAQPAAAPQPEPAAAPASDAARKPMPRAAEMLPVAPAAGRAAPAPAAAVAPPGAPAVQAAAVPAPAAAPAELKAAAAPSATAGEAHAAYKVQVGGFSTQAQAEALQSRLSAEGIPSRIETRVVVGPFADRGEALAAQARLREKGFVAGELIQFRR